MLRQLAIVLFVLAPFATASAADGKRYAVLVGVQKYNDPAFVSTDYAERDVTELADAFKVAGYEVALLTDAAGRKDKALDPTRVNIETALKAALGKCQRDDLILVAFAGHGARTDAKSAGYLCPKDAKPLPDGKASLMSVDVLRDDLAGSTVGAAVLLIDACPKATDGARPTGVDGSGLKVPNRVFALFSCSAGERAIENKDAKHGVFFGQVLAGLSGPAADGDDVITFAALAKYVRAEVPKQAAKLVKGAKQTPTVSAPEKAAQAPILAQHPAALPVTEWAEYVGMWSKGGTKPFLVAHAPKRFAAWRKAAEAGSARGMMLLADCYEFGTGIAKDPKASASWYGKSAARGNTFAMVGIGICYQRGFGVTKDEKEAARWFRTGAELGDPGCMEFLGSCYMSGRGATMDEKEAVKWYRKSVEAGFAQAMFSLGMCYSRGTGVEKDMKEALRWFRKGVDAKNASCALFLGLCYKDGQGVDKDAKEALRWFRAGFDLGSAPCAFYLGICYQTGDGVEKDEKQAVSWYRKAAELEDTDAMNLLAVCYLEGIGVEADEKQAVNWLRKAAELEDADAMLGLGVCYLKGTGVAKDKGEAAKWLRKAAAQGNTRAKELLKSISD